jgi:membrane protein YqaA with SNARE-associated domain
VGSAAAPIPEDSIIGTPWSRVARLLPLGLSLVVTLAAAPLAIVITQQFDDPSRFGPFAYPLLFVTQALVSATVFLPAPGLAVAAAAGTFLHPLWVGVVAGLGSATGELTGYLLGYYGRRAVPTDTSRLWRIAERGFRRWGVVAIVVFAMIPNPVFDALGILAGGLRYPLGRFWLATAVGKIVKLCIFSYLGWQMSLWLRVGP